MHVKYFDYKIYKNFKYKIESQSEAQGQKIGWELPELKFRLYLFEEVKKKHLYVYLATKEESIFIVNHLIFFNN